MFLLNASEVWDKIWHVVVIVIVVLLIVFVLLALAIEYIGKKKALQIDNLMHDVVVTGVITNRKQFVRLANKKNNIYFYKKARIPVLLLVLHFSISFIYLALINSFGQELADVSYGSLWGQYDGVNPIGFGTLFYIFEINPATNGTLGFDIVILNTPHFAIYAIMSYIMVPLFLVGAIWLVFEVIGYVARFIRTHKLGNSIYSKQLDNVKFDNLQNFKYQQGNVSFTHVQEIEKPKEETVSYNTENNNSENKQ